MGAAITDLYQHTYASYHSGEGSRSRSSCRGEASETDAVSDAVSDAGADAGAGEDEDGAELWAHPFGTFTPAAAKQCFLHIDR